MFIEITDRKDKKHLINTNHIVDLAGEYLHLDTKIGFSEAMGEDTYTIPLKSESAESLKKLLIKGAAE